MDFRYMNPEIFERKRDYVTKRLDEIGVFTKFKKENIESMYKKKIGVTYNTYIDVPGKNFLMVELPHCNMQCGYCDKVHLLYVREEPEMQINYITVLEFLEHYFMASQYRNVVISGGEPLLDIKDDSKLNNKVFTLLLTFIVHSHNREVKIHTNGTNYSTIKHMCDTLSPDKYNIFIPDYLALDIKCSKETYPTMFNSSCLCDPKILIDNIFKTLDLVQNLPTYSNGPTNTLKIEIVTPLIPEISTLDEIDRLLPLIRINTVWKFRVFRKKGQHVDPFFNRTYCLLDEENWDLVNAAKRKVIGAEMIIEKKTYK